MDFDLIKKDIFRINYLYSDGIIINTAVILRIPEKDTKLDSSNKDRLIDSINDIIDKKVDSIISKIRGNTIDYSIFSNLLPLNTLDKIINFEKFIDEKIKSKKEQNCEEIDLKKNIFRINNTTSEEIINKISEFLKIDVLRNNNKDKLITILNDKIVKKVDEIISKIKENNIEYSIFSNELPLNTLDKIIDFEKIIDDKIEKDRKNKSKTSDKKMQDEKKLKNERCKKIEKDIDEFCIKIPDIYQGKKLLNLKDEDLDVIENFIKNKKENQTHEMKALQYIKKSIIDLDINIKDVIKNNKAVLDLDPEEQEKILRVIYNKTRQIDKIINKSLSMGDKLLFDKVSNISELNSIKNVSDKFNFYINLIKKYYTQDKPDEFVVLPLIYFINIFEKNFNYLKNDFYTNYINKIKIKKITEDKIDKKITIYFFNISGKKNINYFKLNLRKDKNILDELKIVKNSELYPNDIGDLNIKILYELDCSALENTSTFFTGNKKAENKIIICILISNYNENDSNIEITNLGLKKEIFKCIYDKNSEDYNYNEIKALLLLFKIYIDTTVTEQIKLVTKGGSLNKSYQLYMNAKNKYYIIYDKKNIYLNKDNTYKKNNKLYVKVNGTNNLEIKY